MALRRIDLALRIHEPSDKISVFKVNFVHLAFAEKTGLFFSFYDGIAFVIHNPLFHGLKRHILYFHFILFFVQIDSWYFFSVLGWSGR